MKNILRFFLFALMIISALMTFVGLITWGSFLGMGFLLFGGPSFVVFLILIFIFDKYNHK